MVLRKSRPKKLKAAKHKRRRPDFIVAWLRAPLAMGAIMPSSRALARALASRVDLDHDGLVIELGAGTGVVTDALVKAGIPPEKLLVIEREQRLYDILVEQFPKLNILCADACQLDRVLKDMGSPCVNAIVSSLPMITLPKTVKNTIQKHMAQSIREGGAIVQFTYGAQSPLNRNELRHWQVTGKRVKTVLTNMPPAHVWLYRKASTTS